MSGQRSLVVASNTSWSVVNFRADLIEVLLNRGFRVQVIAPPDRFSARFKTMGAGFHPLALDARGTSPLRDALLIGRYRQLLAHLRPVAYLGFTAKPNIFGGLAAQSLGIPVVNNIAGLGTTFVSPTWLTPLVEILYRVSLARSHKVFFQNADDMAMFVERRVVTGERAALLAGSGVNLTRFAPARQPVRPDGEIRFLLLGRLLWEKGVGIYVEAARIVRAQYPQARFSLLGPAGVDMTTGAGSSVIDSWVKAEILEYIGEADDVRPHIASADCVVLPSFYREGVPRSLLEAAAMARPIITTNMPGCRVAVEDGTTGYLCRPRDVDDLVEKMMKMIGASPEERTAMGEAGRKKMEREFDQRTVAARYLDCLREIAPRVQPTTGIVARSPADAR